MAYIVEPGRPPRVRNVRGTVAVLQGPTELLRDGVVLACEAANPLRRLAARLVDEWTQGLAGAIISQGSRVADVLDPTPQFAPQRSPGHGFCTSQTLAVDVTAALPEEAAAEPASHGGRRRRQPTIGGSAA